MESAQFNFNLLKEVGAEGRSHAGSEVYPVHGQELCNT